MVGKRQRWNVESPTFSSATIVQESELWPGEDTTNGIGGFPKRGPRAKSERKSGQPETAATEKVGTNQFAQFRQCHRFDIVEICWTKDIDDASDGIASVIDVPAKANCSDDVGGSFGHSGKYRVGSGVYDCEGEWAWGLGLGILNWVWPRPRPLGLGLGLGTHAFLRRRYPTTVIYMLSGCIERMRLAIITRNRFGDDCILRG